MIYRISNNQAKLLELKTEDAKKDIAATYLPARYIKSSKIRPFGADGDKVVLYEKEIKDTIVFADKVKVEVFSEKPAAK